MTIKELRSGAKTRNGPMLEGPLQAPPPSCRSLTSPRPFPGSPPVYTSPQHTVPRPLKISPRPSPALEVLSHAPGLALFGAWSTPPFAGHYRLVGAGRLFPPPSCLGPAFKSAARRRSEGRGCGHRGGH